MAKPTSADKKIGIVTPLDKDIKTAILQYQSLDFKLKQSREHYRALIWEAGEVKKQIEDFQMQKELQLSRIARLFTRKSYADINVDELIQENQNLRGRVDYLNQLIPESEIADGD